MGKKACLVGQALEIHYFRGKNYLEVTMRVPTEQSYRRRSIKDGIGHDGI